MSNSVRPSEVYAVVVGIEKYKAGPEYDLNGPANDALKFVSWLLDQGVDPEHVHLFLSPLDRNTEELSTAQSLGLTPLPAIHDLTSTTIRSQLTSEYGKGGEVLYIFWGGHGIVTKTEMTTRRLFFADTDDETKWNLNFNSLVEALSTSAHGTGFDQQIFLIDACANAYYQGLTQTIQGEVAEVKFAASGEVDRSDQFVLFASAEYEVAANESDSGTGSFSKAVLEVLRDQPLFPDMSTLTKQVQTKFREQQKIEPVYWWRKLRGSEEEVNNTGQATVINSTVSEPDSTVLEPSRQLPSFKQIKLSALEKRQEVLIRQYEAASNQLNTTLSEAGKVTISEQVKIFEKKLMQLEDDITKLLSS